MALARIHRPQQLIKPFRGARLIPGHPHNKGLEGFWLLNEGAGSLAADISGNGNHGTLQNGAAWKPGKGGSSVEFDGINDEINMGTDPPKLVGGWSQFTIVVCVYFVGGQDWAFLYRSRNVQLYKYGTGNNIGGWIRYNMADVDTGVSYNVNAWQTIAMVYNGQDVRWYKNGIKIHTKTGISGTVASLAGGTVSISNDVSGTLNGKIDYARFYSRAFSEYEMLDLHLNRWAGVWSPRNWAFVDLGVGGSIALIGNLDATSSLSGATSVNRKMAGSIDAVATLTGLIEALKNLQGSVGGTSVLNGGTEVSRKLIGSINSTSTVDGTFEVLRELTGAIPATSDLVGILTIAGDVALVGSIDAISSAVAGLKVGKRLSGSISATSTLTDAQLNVLRNISGAISGLSTLNGDLKGAKLLIGTVNAASSLSGAAGVVRELAGVIDGIVTVDGILEVNKSLAGSTDAVSVLSGILSTGIIPIVVTADRRVFVLDTKRRVFTKDTERRVFTIH